MGAVLERSPAPTASAWQELPPVVRVLYITNRRRTGGWLAEAFAAERAAEIRLEEALGSAAGLARLRDELFDAVLVSHEPDELDALALVAGYRGGGADEPIIVLGKQSEQELAAPCYEAGADAYICADTTTTRALVWIFARSVQRHQLMRENRRLEQAERQRLEREHLEAQRLLDQQRSLIADLEQLCVQPLPPAAAVEPVKPASGRRAAQKPRTQAAATRPSAPAPWAGLPGELVQVYRELLRTYVIMGTGNLADELGRLAELLAAAGVTARQAMQLHLHVLEELLGGLGTRSSRHVMTRADLLVMEIMIHLAENYRVRYADRVKPPAQRILPGFDEPAPVAF